MLVADKEFARESDLVANNPRRQPDYLSFRDTGKVLPLDPSQFVGRLGFAWHLAIYFPEIARRIDEDDFGVLNLEVGALRLASEAAIVEGDWDMLARHFAFVAALQTYCGEAVRRALSVSYLGRLFYGECSRNYAKARMLLPPALARALEVVERHYEDLPH